MGRFLSPCGGLHPWSTTGLTMRPFSLVCFVLQTLCQKMSSFLREFVFPKISFSEIFLEKFFLFIVFKICKMHYEIRSGVRSEIGWMIIRINLKQFFISTQQKS